MATITAKIISASQDDKKAEIVVEFQNGNTWQKTYTLRQTEPMKFADFKEMVIADIGRDYKFKGQLLNIDNQIGKTFTITV